MRSPKERAQSTVELAVLLPVIVLLIMLAVQAGVLARERVQLVHATRAAARAVIVDPTEAAALAVLRSSGPPADRAQVALSGDRSPGGVLTLTVRTTPTAVPIVGRVVAGATLSERLGVVVEGAG